jgi:osmotically-inducible protein OsmY
MVTRNVKWAAASFVILAGITGACGGTQKASNNADDSAIASSVRAKLFTVFEPIEAKQVKQLERGADKETISYLLVKSQDGVVTLTGEVRTNQAKVRAGELARSVPGVARVNNNLAISPGYSDDAVGKE